ncbi:MAG: hypothetical protein Tsb0020_42170 [Haliangiales bacterium]
MPALPNTHSRSVHEASRGSFRLWAAAAKRGAADSATARGATNVGRGLSVSDAAKQPSTAIYTTRQTGPQAGSKLARSPRVTAPREAAASATGW